MVKNLLFLKYGKGDDSDRRRARTGPVAGCGGGASGVPGGLSRGLSGSVRVCAERKTAGESAEYHRVEAGQTGGCDTSAGQSRPALFL